MVFLMAGKLGVRMVVRLVVWLAQQMADKMVKEMVDKKVDWLDFCWVDMLDFSMAYQLVD
jgi:hypothetical protein